MQYASSSADKVYVGFRAELERKKKFMLGSGTEFLTSCLRAVNATNY